MGPRWKPHPDTKTGSGSPTAKQCREDTDNGKQTTGAEGATKKNNCRSFHSTFQNRMLLRRMLANEQTKKKKIKNKKLL